MRASLAATLGLLLPVLPLAGCFDSDDTSLDADVPDTTTRGGKPNGEAGDETEDSGETGPPPDIEDPEVTCGDAVLCILDCASDLQGVSGDEVDLSCFFDCEHGLTVEEALELVEYGACIFNYCTDGGACEATPENPLAPLDADGPCIACLGVNLSVPPSTGECEAEYNACFDVEDP